MLDDFLARIKEEQIEKERFSDNLTFTNEYMEWLDKNTKQNPIIATDTFLYHESTVPEKDLKNAKAIQYLFEEISDYCVANYIEPKQKDYGVYYSIKNNEIGYHVGYDGGQGASFYCIRLEEPDDDALDFRHVRSGVKLQKTLYDEYLLEDLTGLIRELYNAGVSLTAIKKVTESTIDSIEIEKNNKRKK